MHLVFLSLYLQCVYILYTVCIMNVFESVLWTVHTFSDNSCHVRTQNILLCAYTYNFWVIYNKLASTVLVSKQTKYIDISQ